MSIQIYFLIIYLLDLISNIYSNVVQDEGGIQVNISLSDNKKNITHKNEIRNNEAGILLCYPSLILLQDQALI